MGERDGVEVIEDIEPFCLVAREIFPSAFDDFEGVESIVDADALLQGGAQASLDDVVECHTGKRICVNSWLYSITSAKT